MPSIEGLRVVPGKPQWRSGNVDEDALLRASAEPALLGAGLAMIPHAARLLTRIGAPLLTVATFRGDAAIRLIPWSPGLTPGTALDMSEAAFWPEVELLVDTGSEALRQIALRWPGYALPPAIGLITDGTGLAASGDDPSGLSADWLLDPIRSSSPPSILVPFAPTGIWSLLSPDMVPANSGGRH